MSKRRGPDDRKRLDPEDVIAGRIKVGAGELLDLIHRVNPTGRELGAREAELRYAQKARLQSLLVRRFGPELSVVPDPASDGTVSILHRGHGRDGCHAVLDTLDEDARAWVRLQLDLGPSSSEAPPPPAPEARPSGRGLPPADEDEGPSSTDASPESLVRRAYDAVASYDFERARAHLERAAAASGGAAGPAAALLALLVETLGDDASALALQPSLSRAALAHPDVRALLALAAARSGDPEQAVALLRGAGERRTAEVSAALASRAIVAGNAEQAAAHLAELRRRDPAHPAIVGLADEVARLLAAARGPFEAELAALVAAGQEGEAEKKAALLLARWPESEAARRVVRAAEERRRLAHEAAVHRAREIEAAHQAKRDAERAAHARALLAAPDPREGLLAWLELDPALRRRIGEPQEEAELRRWIDLTPARAAPAARVEAVLAIRAARQLLPSDPEGAIDALAPHEATLERVPEAKRIAREAHAAIVARRAARAREEVAAARRDLAGGDAASALARLDAAVLRDLGDAELAGAEALRAEAARIVLKEKRVAEVGRLRLRAQLFEARALADELRAEASGEERPRWEQERQAIQDEIQRAFRVEIDRGPFPPEGRARPDTTLPAMEAPVWLTEDGRTLVLVEGRERWVWIQLVDVESRTVRAEVMLRAPERVGNVIAHVLGSTAWLTSGRGGLLAIDVERFTVELFLPARELLAPGYHLGGVAIAADRGASRPRYYWLVPADDKDSYACPAQVVDLETRRVVREIAISIRLAAIPGTREARIGGFKSAGLMLYEDRGTPAPEGHFPRQDVSIVHAAVHPSREGFVAAGPIAPTPWHRVRIPPPGSRLKQRPEAALEGTTVLLDLTARPAQAPWIIEGLEGGTVVTLASSRDTGLCAITLMRGGSFRWEVVMVRPAGGTFDLVYRVDVPSFASTVRDAGARHMVLYAERPEVIAPLGPTAPDLPVATRRPSPWISDVCGAPACLGSAGARAEAYRAVVESVKTLALDAIAATSKNLQKEGDPEALVERARGLAAAPDDDDAHTDARRLRGWLWEHYPENARVRLLRADERAVLGHWGEVREILAPCASASFPDDEDHAQHLCHLLALAALRVGDVEEATRRAAEAAGLHGSCQLEGLAALLAPRPRPEAALRQGPFEAATPLPLTELVWAIHAADAHLDAGDAEGALAALDPWRLDTGDEVQVLARRAEAWLLLSPPPGRSSFAKIMGLARLIDAHEGAPDEEREELPVPGAMWDRSRLDEVVSRAAAWLSAQRTDEGGGTLGSPHAPGPTSGSAGKG